MPNLDLHGMAVLAALGIHGNHKFPLGQRRLDLGEMGAKFQKIEAGGLAGAASDNAVQFASDFDELGDF